MTDETKQPLLSHLMGSHNEATWNAAHPIGTRVRYWPILPPIDSAPPLDTTTRSEAWTLGDGSVVVKVVGRSGGVHLGHLEWIGSPKPWDDGAVYYSTSADDERLTHTTLDECIEGHLDDLPVIIEKAVAGGITVYAWARGAIDIEVEAKSALDNMVESLSLHLLEEYGDPDGDSEDIFGPEVEEAFKVEALQMVSALVAKAEAWRCTVVGERTFTADELMAWVRKHRPEWIEGKS